MVTHTVEDHRQCPFRYKDCEWTEDMAYCTLGSWFCYGASVPECCPLLNGPITVELSAKEQDDNNRRV